MCPIGQVLVRAAIDLMPHWTQKILQFDGRGLHRWEAELVRQAGAIADRLVLEVSAVAVSIICRVRYRRAI